MMTIDLQRDSISTMNQIQLFASQFFSSSSFALARDKFIYFLYIYLLLFYFSNFYFSYYASAALQSWVPQTICFARLYPCFRLFVSRCICASTISPLSIDGF